MDGEAIQGKPAQPDPAQPDPADAPRPEVTRTPEPAAQASFKDAKNSAPRKTMYDLRVELAYMTTIAQGTILAFLVLRYFQDKMLADEFTTALGITLPAFGGMVGVAISWMSADPYLQTAEARTRERTAAPHVVNVVRAIVLFYWLLVIGVILKKTTSFAMTMEDLKRFLMGVETAAAAGLGLFYSVFNQAPPGPVGKS